MCGASIVSLSVAEERPEPSERERNKKDSKLVNSPVVAWSLWGGGCEL
jgi:hypothetical protein